MKNYYGIDKLLKNVNVLQVGTGKMQTTHLYSDTKKVKFLIEKHIKISEIEHALNGLLVLIMLKFKIFFKVACVVKLKLIFTD